MLQLEMNATGQGLLYQLPLGALSPQTHFVTMGWEQLQRKWLCAGLSFLSAGCAEVPTRASGDFLLSFLPSSSTATCPPV